MFVVSLNYEMTISANEVTKSTLLFIGKLSNLAGAKQLHKICELINKFDDLIKLLDLKIAICIFCGTLLAC